MSISVILTVPLLTPCVPQAGSQGHADSTLHLCWLWGGDGVYSCHLLGPFLNFIPLFSTLLCMRFAPLHSHIPSGSAHVCTGGGAPGAMGLDYNSHDAALRGVPGRSERRQHRPSRPSGDCSSPQRGAAWALRRLGCLATP